ncbi:hypothetical protein [Virgibacillus necropolis]|uniref:Uncharacterized protein n=1 Tax=Virgibacillus necropolis TaxID=163877 RepID=A0A221M899_9BACI|nr:hypothetical protein [Virgibacillus necropolis]ASN03855.1 hypothetical protein CFK40_01980 [Virgibacillus necropolis]
MTPCFANDMIQEVTDVGEPLVWAARKRAMEQWKEKWGFVKRIVRMCAEKEIAEVEVAQTEARGHPAYLRLKEKGKTESVGMCINIFSILKQVYERPMKNLHSVNKI